MLEFLKIDLSSNIAVFIIIVMFFFSLFLVFKIKKLKVEIENLKFEDKTIFEKKVSNVEEDIVAIGKISKDNNIKYEEENDLSYKDSINVDNKFNSDIVVKDDFKKEKVVVNKEDNINKCNKDTSFKVENIENGLNDYSDDDFANGDVDIEKASFNLDEFVRNNGMNKDKVGVFQNNNEFYLEEISKRMADEVVPQTIELTDYEKDQEENAIISYQELLNVRNNVSVLGDEEETFEFIEELKKFRNSLN